MGVVGVVVFYNMWTTNKYAYMLIRTTHHLSCCCFDSLDRYECDCTFISDLAAKQTKITCAPLHAELETVAKSFS